VENKLGLKIQKLEGAVGSFIVKHNK
jgi:hypothetical protein